MYIKYQETNYPCTCYPSNERMVYSDLPEDFPAPVEGEIVLCADDGFEMRVDNSADYLRQTFEGGVLTLTNEPDPVEPDPIPDPPPTPADPAAAVWDEMAAAIAEGVNYV